MTRDQALAIINNLDLIRSFAEGKHIAIPINGRLFSTNTLVLSNFRSDRPIGYVVVQDNYEFQH